MKYLCVKFKVIKTGSDRAVEPETWSGSFRITFKSPCNRTCVYTGKIVQNQRFSQIHMLDRFFTFSMTSNMITC